MSFEKTAPSPVVLIASCDPDICSSSASGAMEAGCVFETVEANITGLSLLGDIRPDVIVFDATGCEDDGVVFCERLREAGLKIPVIMILDDRKKNAIRFAYDAGAVDFVTKPVDWFVLGCRIHHIWRSNRTMEDLKSRVTQGNDLLKALPDTIRRISRTGMVLEAGGASDLHDASLWNARRGRRICDAMPEWTTDHIMRLVRQVLQKGGIETGECEGEAGAGSCHCEIRIVRNGLDEGLVILRRRGDGKQTERALQGMGEHYALAAMACNDGLWDWDLKANEVYYSGRWKAMLGYGEDEIGTSADEWLQRIHPADIDQVKLEIKKHLDGGCSHFEHEYRMRDKEGSYRWMLARGVAVREGDGAPTRMAGFQTDISLRKRAEERLIKDAFYDVLTGLPNRALFMDRLNHALKRLKRLMDGYGFAVLFLDLDRFKVVNDSLGHMTGDALLTETARRLEKCVRPGDTVARLGGDEFVILFDDVRDAESARAIAERVQAALSAPYYVNSCEVFSSASIGIALSSKEYDRPEDILRDADITMYRAKALGKARVEIFDPSLRARAISLLNMETDLRRALDRGEFRVHYQPIVALGTDAILSLEALIRWQHPQEGLLSPGRFIPVAEETGLIVSIGEWVMRKVCSDIGEWQASGSEAVRVAVNISPVQLRRPDFVRTTQKILNETGVSGDSLGIEISENVLLDRTTATVEMLDELKALGVQIILDDFGTGYSSLNYLQNLPIDILKIDRSFVAKLIRDDEHSKIIETIILLGRSLGIDVVAEGIETTEQLERLKTIHCDKGQGFLFCEPLEGQEISDLLRSRGTGHEDHPVRDKRRTIHRVGSAIPGVTNRG